MITHNYKRKRAYRLSFLLPFNVGNIKTEEQNLFALPYNIKLYSPFNYFSDENTYSAVFYLESISEIPGRFPTSPPRTELVSGSGGLP